MDSLLHLLLRLTARISFVLFILAFAAPGLANLWPGELTERLRRHRQHFLLGFATSHTFHLALVITMVAGIMGWAAFLAKFTWVTVIVGGFAFLLIYALAANSVAELRSRGVPTLKPGLVSFAMYYLWTMFALVYIPRSNLHDPLRSLFALAALAAFVIRLVGRRRIRARFKAAAQS